MLREYFTMNDTQKRCRFQGCKDSIADRRIAFHVADLCLKPVILYGPPLLSRSDYQVLSQKQSLSTAECILQEKKNLILPFPQNLAMYYCSPQFQNLVCVVSKLTQTHTDFFVHSLSDLSLKRIEPHTSSKQTQDKSSHLPPNPLQMTNFLLQQMQSLIVKRQ